jgi:hypothetical protein
VRAGDDVVDELDVHQSQGLARFPGVAIVFAGRCWVTRRVVVVQDNPDGIGVQRLTDDLARGDDGTVDGADVERAFADDAAA